MSSTDSGLGSELTETQTQTQGPSGVFVDGDPKDWKPLPYYKDLKRADFESDEDYLLERARLGMEAGYTYMQCQDHWFCDLERALYKGSDEASQKRE